MKLKEYHATRVCRRCKNPVEVTRYFECESCKPELGEDVDDWTYFGEEESKDSSEESAL